MVIIQKVANIGIYPCKKKEKDIYQAPSLLRSLKKKKRYIQEPEPNYQRKVKKKKKKAATKKPGSFFRQSLSFQLLC